MIILLLSVTTIGMTLFSLYSNQDDAEIMNITSSLRMQSYRLALDVETQSSLLHRHVVDYARTLHSVNLKAIEHEFTPDSLVQSYRQLLTKWTELQPILVSGDKQTYLDEVDAYANQIDDFVYELHKFTQFKLQLLLFAYGLVFIFILIVVLYVIYFSQRKIVKPLRQLMIASKEVQAGNFSFKPQVKSYNELGILTATFNTMTTNLEKHYLELEQKIAEKTHRLSHAKNSLELLYGCQKELSANYISEQNFKNILNFLLATEGVIAVRMVVKESGTRWQLNAGEESNNLWHSEELKFDDKVVGELAWQYTLPCPDQELIVNVANIISRGLHYNKTQKQNQQLLLVEERATIARELHDSIAQSLSYLKIQTTLLNRSISNKDFTQSSETAKEIDKQLSATYSQLRELLNTFRLTIGKADLGEALQELLQSLEKMSDSKIILDNKITSISLKANQQVHVIQLVREAVLNAIKHAEASEIKIKCRQYDKIIYIYVIDNGIGFADNKGKPNHYGLTIMSERAERLNGNLEILTNPNEGCTIELLFPL